MNKYKFDVRGHLKNIIESKEEPQKQIADKIGISASHLSKFLNGQEIALWMVLEIVRYLDKDNEIEIMRQCCYEATKKNIKTAFEYAHSKKLDSMTTHLIGETINGSNRELREWALVYGWQLESKYSRVYSEVEYLEKLKPLKPSSQDLKTLLLILEMLCFYYSGKFDLSLHYVEKIHDMLPEIKDPFIKKAFLSRTDEALANMYLKFRNNKEQARERATKLIERNFSVNSVTNGFFISGLSYFYESYDNAAYYFKRGIELNNTRDRYFVANDLREQLAILNMFWERPVSKKLIVSEFIKNVVRQNNLEQYYDYEVYSALAFYFDGKREKSIEKLLLSLHIFCDKKDYFRANLPKIELLKLGVDYNIIKRGVNISEKDSHRDSNNISDSISLCF
ncbi:transcriptional regulator [Bacillus amyloliquefaciens]|nr:transcriptional regulator [Bacillus amyloliquefaciens]